MIFSRNFDRGQPIYPLQAPPDTDEVRRLEPSEPKTEKAELDLNDKWGWELWRYRELLFFLIWLDVKIRYKQTI